MRAGNRKGWDFSAFDSGIGRKICSDRYLCLYVRWYVGYFGGCIYFRRERVGLSYRSCSPALVFCFMYCFMLSSFCLAYVCVFFLCRLFLFVFFFLDVFKSTMWSNLQAAVPPNDHHLGPLAS